MGSLELSRRQVVQALAACGATDAAATLPVDETFSLHPSLGALHSRFAAGTVALLPAAGIPEMSRSHFDAQFRLEEAGLPRLLAGTDDAIVASSLAGLRLGSGRAEPPTSFSRGLARMWHDTSSATASAALAGLGAVQTAATMAADTGSGDGASNDHGVSDTIAAMNAGIGTEVAVVNIGGWVTANSSQGCDHGRGGLVILAGPGVSAGVHGDWPGLADLQDGDVRTVNDTPTVMAEVTAQVLGSDPAVVMPDAPATAMGLFG